MDESPTTANAEDGPPQWLLDFVLWVGKDPYDFLFTLFLYLSPLFLLSAILAYKLSQQIESKEKEKKNSSRKGRNIRNVRRAKTD